MRAEEATTADQALKHTPLHALHVERGARMVPFAGYDMPVQYPPGVLKEHLHTREAASLFDVSHMGQIALAREVGPAGGGGACARASRSGRYPGLKPGRMRYSFFTNGKGGILDDLMVANCGDHFLLIVNASRKAEDEAHLAAALGTECEIERARSRADRAPGA